MLQEKPNKVAGYYRDGKWQEAHIIYYYRKPPWWHRWAAYILFKVKWIDM